MKTLLEMLDSVFCFIEGHDFIIVQDRLGNRFMVCDRCLKKK